MAPERVAEMVRAAIAAIDDGEKTPKVANS